MVSTRLGEYLRHKGLRAHTLEDAIGASRSTLSRPITQGKNIGSHFLEKILIECTDLNPKWLMTGEGEMLNEFDEANSLEEPTPPYIADKTPYLDAINHIVENKRAYLSLPQFQVLLDSLFLQERYRKTDVNSTLTSIQKLLEVKDIKK